jgi:hypothetical protein
MTVLGIHDLLHNLLPDGVDPVDDATFRASIERTIQDEQAIVDAQLAEGRNLIINKTDGSKRMIHRADCPSVSRYLDRRASWFPWGWGLDELRVNMRRGGFSPKMPVLATEAEVEELSSYHACRNCQPGLKQTQKIYVASKTSNVNNLTERHIGRIFTAEGLDSPFTLAKIEHTITAEGISTILHDHTGPVPLGSAARILMLPRP